MRAFTSVKAFVVWKRERKGKLKNHGRIHETSRRHNIKKEFTSRSPSSLEELDAFSAQRDELFHQNLLTKGMRRKIQAVNRASRNNQYLHHQENPLVDGCQGKCSPPAPSSDIWKNEKRYPS
jgi:hypothetical protein